MTLSPIGGLVSGVLIGYAIGRDGRRLMVVCPPSPDGRMPTPGELMPVAPAPGAGPVRVVAPAGVVSIAPLDELLLRPFRPPDASTTYYLETLVDARLAVKMLLVISGNVNQALTIQVVGHVGNLPRDANNLVNIGSTFTLASGGDVLAFAINLDERWMPYYGLTIATGGTAPTSGNVQVKAYGQQWVKSESEVRV